MTLEQIFQSQLTDLSGYLGYLGVPVFLRPSVYAQDVADALTFPGHQNPRHRRCRVVRYCSEYIREEDFRTSDDPAKLARETLDRLQPEVRKLIEGATELHSADWRLVCVPDREHNPFGDLFNFVVTMYIDIGEAFTIADKPKEEARKTDPIVEHRDYYTTCLSCKNRDTTLIGKWDDEFNAGVAARKWRATDSVRSCHCCGAKWVSDLYSKAYRAGKMPGDDELRALITWATEQLERSQPEDLSDFTTALNTPPS